MSAIFTSGELTDMQNVQSEHMQDLATVDTYSVTYNSYNEPIEVWTSGSGIDCGVEMTGGVERYKGQFTDLDIDVTLRLPINTTITIVDKVTIYKRYGVAVTPVQYSVIGNPRRGPSGLQVNLKQVSQ